jgi:hypothetical protein
LIHIKPEIFATLDGSLRGVRTALQNAIELEHAVMPAYMFALYSIRAESIQTGRNAEIYTLLRSVVLEEMLHMLSACNILNAIGGSPSIDQEKFVPRYPGALPGSVEGQLIVRLRRFSLEQVHDVFMEIEEPEDAQPPTDGHAPQPLTIGAFYRTIAEHITTLGPSIFTGHASRQVTDILGKRPIVAVSDVPTAKQAVELIIEQGEGSTSSPFDEEKELAHFYKFEEIVRGRRLVRKPGESPPYAFTGDLIPFDADGVWPVMDDPHSADYPAGSQARRASDVFNYTYTNLLKVLQHAVTGEPARIPDAVRLMESLRHQALDLVTLRLPSGEHAGPTFEYQPVCPA